jgi:histidine triad (HIT) family protein
MSAVIRIGRAIEIALQPEGMNLISSSGAVAEQTVNHVHLHVVPRWRSDGIDRIWPPAHKMPERLKDDVADQVRGACADLDNLE